MRRTELLEIIQNGENSGVEDDEATISIQRANLEGLRCEG